FFLSFFLLFLVTNNQTSEPLKGFRNFGALLLNSSLLKTLYYAFFLALMIRSFLRYRIQLARLDLKWTSLLISFFGLLTLFAVSKPLFASHFRLANILPSPQPYLFSVFILGPALLLPLLPDLVTTPLFQRIDDSRPKEKYQNSGLTPAMALSL